VEEGNGSSTTKAVLSNSIYHTPRVVRHRLGSVLA
jgi:hypothetical protein